MLLLVISGLAFFVKKGQQQIAAKKWKANHVTKIKYNQTYTYKVGKDHTDYPAYIKFLDGSHYIAMPMIDLTRDPEVDDGIQIDFLQGSYRRKDNKICLGKKIITTTLLFNSYGDFKRGKFIKEVRKGHNPKEGLAPFEGNYIKKQGKYYTYRWKTRIGGGHPLHYITGFVRLKKSKLDIPSTEKEFIQRYHKKQKRQLE